MTHFGTSVMHYDALVTHSASSLISNHLGDFFSRRKNQFGRFLFNFSTDALYKGTAPAVKLPMHLSDMDSDV